jgi:hypothetical protein
MRRFMFLSRSAIWKALVAGLIGMIAHWLLMRFKAQSGILPHFDPYASLQRMLTGFAIQANTPVVPWIISFLNGFLVISLTFRIVYRWLPGNNGAVKGFVYGFVGWAIMGLIFFPVLGLGIFALNMGEGIAPALFSFAMVQTYSIVMGLVYGALRKPDCCMGHHATA